MFVLLTALVARFGGLWLISIQPDILALSLKSMGSDSHCQAVTAFLRELLSKTLTECNKGKRTAKSPGKTCTVTQEEHVSFKLI